MCMLRAARAAADAVARGVYQGAPVVPSTSPSMEVMSRRKRAVIGVCLGILVAGLLWAMRDTEALQRPELALVDLRTRVFTGTRPPDDRIVMLIVTEEEIKRAKLEKGFLEWPWDQSVQAYAVNFMKQAGIRSLVLDFLYLDRGVDPNELDPKPSEEVLDAFYGPLESAQDFGAALKELGCAVVGVEMVRAGDPIWQIASREKLVATHNDWDEGRPELPSRFRRRRRGAARVRHPERRGRRRLRDGAGRRGRHGPPGGRRRLLGLGRTTGARRRRRSRSPARAWAVSDAAVFEEGGVSYASVEGSRQRLSEDGSFLVNFRATPFGNDSYKTVSIWDLVIAGYYLDEGEELTEHQKGLLTFLKDKIVIWGANYAGRLDEIPTPVDRSYLGPEYHATAMDNILHGDGRVPLRKSTSTVILFVLCAALGLFSSIDPSGCRPYLVALAVILVYVGLAFWVFRHGWSIDIFTPVAGIA